MTDVDTILRAEIRAARYAGSSYASIGRLYGMNPQVVGRICRGIPTPPRRPAWDNFPVATLLDAMHAAHVSIQAARRGGWELKKGIETGQVDAYKASDICIKLLHKHPVEVFGSVWWESIIDAEHTHEQTAA